MRGRCIQVVLILLLCAVHSAMAQTPGGWTRTIASDGDVHLEVFHKGAGYPVLMHPSLGRPAQDFEALGNHVSGAGYHVILINPRQIGDSTGPMAEVTLLDLGADVWMVAESLELDRVFLLGQNFGNRVARTASSLQPERVIGLILLAPGGEVQPTKEIQAEFDKVFNPALSDERHLQAVANSFFAPGNDATVWKDGWFGKTATLQTGAVKRTDFARLYMGGTAPGLIVQGLDDRIAPPQNAWDLVKVRRGTRLVAFPNMGHAMLPENPGAIAGAVIDFLLSEAPPE